MDNLHCKHIILCAPEKSYTGFLRNFVSNGKISDRITLVETIQFPQCLAELSSNFPVAKFPKVFRDARIVTDLPTRLGRIHQTSGIPACSYASTASKAVTSPAQPSDHKDSISRRILQEVPVNAKGQRVDPKLPHYDGSIVTVLKDRKLCYQHFLSRCTHPGRCTHSHNASLNPTEIAALRFIARLSACENGFDCRDPNCVASHMCRYGPRCKNPANCRYPIFMHGLDPKPVGSAPAWS